MISRPFDEIKQLIDDYLKREYSATSEISWSKSPSANLGDISFPLFNIAKEVKTNPIDLGKSIIATVTFPETVKEVSLQGGFLNINLNKKIFALTVLHSILNQVNYGQSSVLSDKRIIVEHTSSNPTGPLHIGNFRGSVLGDVLGRTFQYLGAAVNTRYYVNDLGRQIAPLIIGYFLLKDEKVEPKEKGDLWLGKIYASMNTFLEIQQLKQKLKQLGMENIGINSLYLLNKDDLNLIPEFLKNLSEDNKEMNTTTNWFKKLSRVQKSLKDRIPEIYNILSKLISSQVTNLESVTNEYVKLYQEGKDKSIVGKFREVTKMALKGHIETLNLFEIYHDDFDWESDVAWSGEIETMLDILERENYLRFDDKARLLENDKIAEELGYKAEHSINYEIPDSIIVNSEGTTLYPCRDIVYHLHKLEKFDANLCYNVIAKMQQLPQLAVRLALYGLGRKETADKIHHFDYEYVSLIGRKMAGREFDYVTPDELYVLAKDEIKSIIENRGYSKDEQKKIAEKIAASSIKYHILKMDPQKAVAFDVKKAVDPNANSGSFLQYSYARALSILRKAAEQNIDVQQIINAIQKDKLSIEKEAEWELIKLMEELPSVFVKAASSLRPDSIANYAYSLAASFHKFYDACPVLKAENPVLVNTRIIIVFAIIRCLESLFTVMGIDALEKM
ncbi:MAG: arginine--tRNA ligase [Candidatus Heimdallarchaeota archaeon]|nr:arginine--tRNA ligase [Candidatus Heimdallarchaeota archaeon]